MSNEVLNKNTDIKIPSLKFELDETGVLIVRPQSRLRGADFLNLAHFVDPWIQKNGHLHGVVISIKKFPGWEDFGSFVQHLKFVKEHERKVAKVAIAVDGDWPTLLAKIATHFVRAEIRSFAYVETGDAIRWART